MVDLTTLSKGNKGEELYVETFANILYIKDIYVLLMI